MALYFSGTNTGNRYEVGKDYKTGDGRVLTAMPDGSFEKKGNLVGYTDQGKPVVDNVGRGAVSPGSRDNYDTEWHASGSELAAYRSWGQAATPQALTSGGGSSAPAPEGAARVPAPQQVYNAITAANRGAFKATVPSTWGGAPYLNLTRDNYGWSGEELPPQDMVIGGYHLRANPKWSNGEIVEMLFGDNELVSTLYSIFHVPAVLGYNARLVAEENGFAGGQGPISAMDRAFQPEALADTFAGFVSGTRAWAAANYGERDRILEELNDANDLRDELTRVEARKAGDWTAIDGVWNRAELEAERNPPPPGHGWINPGWAGLVPGNQGGW